MSRHRKTASEIRREDEARQEKLALVRDLIERALNSPEHEGEVAYLDTARMILDRMLGQPTRPVDKPLPKKRARPLTTPEGVNEGVRP